MLDKKPFELGIGDKMMKSTFRKKSMRSALGYLHPMIASVLGFDAHNKIAEFSFPDRDDRPMIESTYRLSFVFNCFALVEASAFFAILRQADLEISVLSFSHAGSFLG